MKKYFSLMLVVILLGSLFSSPFVVSAHDADGIFYNKDLTDGLNDYRDVKLFWMSGGKKIDKPISSMTVTTDGKSYRDNGSEDKVSATIKTGTPITIDFANSQSDYDIAEVGLQITNGSGAFTDWTSLPNGKVDTAYASQYPFSWGAATFTPKKAGTYKIYGEVRADIDRSQILYGWDAWSHNGSHGEYADMIAHSSPPAGKLNAYPVKWYFEVVVINVIDKNVTDNTVDNTKAQDSTQGKITVKYIDQDTGKEIENTDPEIIDNLPEGTHKSITARGIDGYIPKSYKKWSGEEDLSTGQTEQKYEGTVGVDISKNQKNWFVYLIYSKVQPNQSNGGEIKLNITKLDGLYKFGFDPQWSQELYKGYEDDGYTYSQVFDMALMDKSCYPDVSWGSKVSFDNMKLLVENARKYRVEVSYNWNQTYHDEWQIVGSHEESYTDSNGKKFTETIEDYGYVKVADPQPVANVTLNTSAFGNVTTQISYNIASGEDAVIGTQPVTSNDSVNFQLNAGETKTFDFSMPLFSQMYPNNVESFSDNYAGTAILNASASATVDSQRCSSCGANITYNQPDNGTVSKNITVMPARVYEHYMHLGE